MMRKDCCPLQREGQKETMSEERGKKNHCSSRSRSLEVTNLPLWWQAQGLTFGVAESNSEWN